MSDVVNGTAEDFAVLDDTGLLSQNCLSVDGGHAQESDDPHPEDSTGAAGQDSAGRTDDVTGTDLCCDSSTQSLEAGHTGLLLFTLQGQLAENILHAFAECANLDELSLEAEEQASAHQQEDQNVVSQEAVCLNNQGQ